MQDIQPRRGDLAPRPRQPMMSAWPRTPSLSRRPASARHCRPPATLKPAKPRRGALWSQGPPLLAPEDCGPRGSCPDPAGMILNTTSATRRRSRRPRRRTTDGSRALLAALRDVGNLLGVPRSLLRGARYVLRPAIRVRPKPVRFSWPHRLRSARRSSRTAEDSVPSAWLRSRAVPRLAGLRVRRLAGLLGRFVLA
jgi:hypothetical protein